MTSDNCPMSAQEALEKYFLDNRARLLEIASFLDRIDRYKGDSIARNDFRYKSFIKALHVIIDSDRERTKNVQLIFSDLSTEPLEKVTDPKAYGACKGGSS